MAEKRKPCLILLLKIPSNGSPNIEKTDKFIKLELFRGDQWEGFNEEHDFPIYPRRHKLFRLRINGRWNDLIRKGNIKWFTKWTFRDLLFKSLKI